MDVQLDRVRFKYILMSLIVLTLFSAYVFGLRVFVVLSVNLITAFIVEYLYEKGRGKRVSKTVVVTAILFTLTLPAKIPLDVSVIGVAFGVLFGKCIYGGDGYNVFNPALVGRLFVHVSFTKEITAVWTRPVPGFFGGYADYIGRTVNAVSSATPILSHRWTGEEPGVMKLLTGLTEGCMGETSAILLLAIGGVLLYKKLISLEIVISILAAYGILGAVGYATTGGMFLNPIYGILSGGVLFGTILMATDPVTSPRKKPARVLYGIIIGIVIFLIRSFSLFTGGTMFAILVGNMLTPILDISVKRYEHYRLSKASDDEGAVGDA